jgi:hypothetical protein
MDRGFACSVASAVIILAVTLTLSNDVRAQPQAATPDIERQILEAMLNVELELLQLHTGMVVLYWKARAKGDPFADQMAPSLYRDLSFENPSRLVFLTRLKRLTEWAGADFTEHLESRSRRYQFEQRKLLQDLMRDPQFRRDALR